MHIEAYRNYCLEKEGVAEYFPFDDNTIVFKIANKIFTLACISPFESINVKCDPEKAIQLREQYASVSPGYHMNKKHWNTVLINKELSDRQIFKFIDESYCLVLSRLPKKLRQSKKTSFLSLNRSA